METPLQLDREEVLALASFVNLASLHGTFLSPELERALDKLDAWLDDTEQN